MKVSLFASAIRPELWEGLLSSLRSNTIEYEVIFSGFIERDIIQEILDKYPEFTYIQTKNIKPAQCYEVARRACKGELIGWTSDDCVYPEKALEKICEAWSKYDARTVLALKAVDPECSNNNLNDQRFFPRNLNTPQIAQLGVMNREYMEHLGGLDRRYIYGKWEYDICMRVLADGGKVVKYEEIEIAISHTSKNGEYTNDWSGVNEDSETIENSWVVEGYQPFEKPLFCIDQMNRSISAYFPISNREVTLNRKDKFEPFEDTDITEKSQSLKARWE